LLAPSTAHCTQQPTIREDNQKVSAQAATMTSTQNQLSLSRSLTNSSFILSHRTPTFQSQLLSPCLRSPLLLARERNNQQQQQQQQLQNHSAFHPNSILTSSRPNTFNTAFSPTPTPVLNNLKSPQPQRSFAPKDATLHSTTPIPHSLSMSGTKYGDGDDDDGDDCENTNDTANVTIRTTNFPPHRSPLVASPIVHKNQVISYLPNQPHARLHNINHNNNQNSPS